MYTYIIWQFNSVSQGILIYGAPYNKKLIKGREVGIYPTWNQLTDRLV